MKDKVVPNNSQVKDKKTEVEDHPRISSISNKIKSVTACNDSLKSRTSNVNAVCGKLPISTRKPKSQSNKSVATPPKKTVASESTIQKSKSYYRMLYEKTSKASKWWIEQKFPLGYKWVPKTKTKWVPKVRNENVKKKVSFAIDNASRITNIFGSNDVMCSYLHSLSDLDDHSELQCLYLHKVKECECLAQKLSVTSRRRAKRDRREETASRVTGAMIFGRGMRHQDSDDDSDDGEVLNELEEYGNVGQLCLQRAINSFYRDDLACQCMIDFRKFVAYFDPFLPMNIITRKAYNTIMVEGLESTGKNLVAIVRDVYVFVGSFTYIMDFVILKDIGTFILRDMGEVLMGKPFRKVTKLEYDCAKGLMSFTRIFDNYTFQMPHTIPRFKSWGHVSWSKIPPILVLSQRDLTNGFRNAYEKNKFMYKNCLNLGPEYQVDESMHYKKKCF
ncbi:hypothetical protein Tco_1418489 [Tanacetum coccineum]